jgi:hypothetical protein
VLATVLFFALTAFGGVALGPLAGFADGAVAGLLLGDLAFLGLAQAGVTQRVGAAVAFFVGQGPQHHP